MDGVTLAHATEPLEKIIAASAGLTVVVGTVRPNETGHGRKLDRIATDSRVAMAFHTRTHGRTKQPGFVLVQGEASVDRRARRSPGSWRRHRSI